VTAARQEISEARIT
jgi:hypothetical protein